MHRTFTCLAATLLLILVVFLLWMQTSPRNTSTGSGPGVDGLTKPRAQTQNSTQAARSSTATRPQLAAGPNTSFSSPFWRPSAVFGKTMAPVPVREFPRGEHFTRRYHEPVSREVGPVLSSLAPSVLARSPEDGRYHLLPEEIDEHTRIAGRMVFDPRALERILDGTTSRLLAPTLTEEVLTLEFETIKTRSANTHTLQGHVVGEESSSIAQIVYHDGVIHGSVMRYDKKQELEYRILPDGHMMLRELDHSTMTDECATCSGDIMASLVEEGAVVDQGEYTIRTDTEEPVTRDSSGWRTLDVVVGYGQEARIADGGYAQIEARIIDAVDRVTSAFANSAIANAELMLLGTIEDPDYLFSENTATDMGVEISDLRTEGDGDLDTITDFSNQLGADLTSFVIKEGRGSTAGVQSADKYTVVSRTNMTLGRMTFAHEIGHCLGAGHAWGDTNNSVVSANYAWRFISPNSGNKYRTITAYNNGIGGTIIPYYSNPNVFFDGARTGAFDGYNVLNDSTADPIFYEENGIRGFDGTNPDLGANNALVIDTGESLSGAGLAYNSAHATRTDFELLTPTAAARWEKGTIRTISFNGGDMDDLATIQLYKGGALHTTLASGVNAATHRNFAWEIPFGLTDGADYMIRVELSRNGSTLFADSGIFEIFSDLPHVNTASAPAVPAVIGQVSSLILTFNVPMNPATFVAGTDIVSFLNPEGTSLLGSITGTTWSAGDTVLTIQFTPPTLQGSYQLTIGPDIEDMAGNLMDQDGDGTTGESIQDRYTATFHVNPPLIRYDNMNTNPGWTFSANNPVNGWAWGQPTGGTGYQSNYGINDPTSGYNGTNVIGYNLTGDYERGITATRWATTPAMNCSNYENVRLRFQRWLGVYNGNIYGDNAYIEVSNDGSNWVQVWHNTNLTINVASWVEVEYDISAVADGQSTVYIRWGMGKTNSSLNDDSCGWNIDEVMVHGDYVDNSDITPPYPSPMTFASAPAAQGVSAITMTATTALDANGVEYFFDETSGNPGGTDSNWQDSATYTDTGLQAGTQYTYTIIARDKSPAQNETGTSAPAYATTDAGPTLTLTISAASIGESDGPGATTATVTRNTDTTSSLVVNLSSNDTTEATVPASITITAGQSTSPVFNVNAVDDAIIDGTQTVTVTATAAAHADGSDSIDVTDDLPLTLTMITGTNGESTSGGGLKDPDGSPFAITATPAAGYSFSQWIVTSGDATFGNENNASTTVETTGDATVQANFVVTTYAVTYAGNGSDGGSVPVDASSPYSYNNIVTVLGNTGALTRTGYSFTGWNTASNGSGTSYVGGNTFSITGNTTLYAQWTATIMLGNLSQVYDGTPKSALVTTNPPGLDHTVTYNGSATAPTNAESYAVVATITDPSYSGSASGSLVIAKASQTITFGELSSVPDTASPFSLTATASSGLVVSYTSSNPSVATVSGSTVTVVGLGDTTITASQTGNSNYNTATPVAQTLTVNRGNPVANPGGPYQVLVGQSLALNASASLPSDGQTITAYEWDLNNDGTFGDVTGVTPAAITDSALATAWGMLEGLNAIQLKITDSAGKTSTVSTTVELIVGLTWDANTSTGGVQDSGGVWIGGNWWDGLTNQTWSSGSAAIFGNGGTGGAVTLASPTTVKKLTFNTFTGTYTLGAAGQMLTINNGITKNASSGTATIISPSTLGAAQTWTNNNIETDVKAANGTLNITGGVDNAGFTLVIDGTGTTSFSNTSNFITGSGGLTKNGAGVLLLGAGGTVPAHNYSGTITINGGGVRINGATSYGTGNLTINNGYLESYYGTSFARTLGSGVGQVRILGGVSGFSEQGSSSTVTLNNDAAFEVVWGAANEAGNALSTGFFNPSVFVLQADTVNSGKSIAFTNKLDLNGTTRTIYVGKDSATTATLSGVLRNSTGTAGLIKEGDGTLVLSAVNTFTGSTTISGGNLRIGNNTAGTLNSGNYAGNISIASGATLQIWSSAAQTLSGIISGDGGLHKAYGSALTLSGPNTYTGKTSFLPQTSAGCTVNITSFNSVNGGTPTLLSSSLGAPTTIANGTIDIGNSGKQAGVNLTYSGTGETTDRVINFGFNGSASQTLTASGSGLLKFTSPMTANSITTQSGKLNLGGTGSGEITQALPALPSGGLSKNGSGTWTLGGANSYTGPTAITAGKLLINGNQTSATGDVTVTASATLGGIGTIGGNTTIAAGGCLEFSLSTAAGSHDQLELASGKTLTFSGASVLTITSTGGAAPGIYTLLTGPGGITGSAPATLVLPSGWTATVSILGNNLLLDVTSITYTITYNSNSATSGTVPANQTKNQDVTLTLATNSGNLARTGYTFAGWNTQADGLGTSYAEGASYTANAALTLYAMWDATPYTSWIGGSFVNTFTDTALTSNPDGDRMVNLQEFAFGMDPTLWDSVPLSYVMDGDVIQSGVPLIQNFAGQGQAADFRAVFARRKDRVAAGLSYSVEFSADLSAWEANATPPTRLTGESSLGDLEAVSVPFPASVPLQAGGTAAPGFFRIGVAQE